MHGGEKVKAFRNHIVLIGFKHVGKSVTGKKLAEKISLPFIDLDQRIEAAYKEQFHQALNCRQIMQQKGEAFFRHLETATLTQLIDFKPSIISVGGGTPMNAENQRILKSCIIIHITAPRGIVYERILMGGLPAFFRPDEDLLESFNKLWDSRMAVYSKLMDFSITNNSSVDDAVTKIIQKLNLDMN